MKRLRASQRLLLMLSRIALFSFCVVLVPIASAQSSGFDGTYRLSVSHERAAATIAHAIEAAVEDMGPLREHIGSNRLEEKNPVLSSIRIALTDRRARIDYGDSSFDLNRGSFEGLTTPDGESARARARVQGNRLIVDWRLDDAQRRDVFVRGEDGTLRLSVRITSDQLPAPVEYQLTYRAS